MSFSMLSVPVNEVADWRHHSMQGKVKESWMQLCEQAAVEQDPRRLLELVQQINQMLEEKDQRLERERSARAEV